MDDYKREELEAELDTLKDILAELNKDYANLDINDEEFYEDDEQQLREEISSTKRMIARIEKKLRVNLKIKE